MALAAGAAVVAATAASVVALAFALYALLEGPFGPAGAAASVAVVFALLIALAGLVAANRARHGGQHHDHDHDSGMVEKLIEIAKQKPLVATAAAVAAGVLALRNPALVGVILTAFMNSKNTDKK